MACEGGASLRSCHLKSSGQQRGHIHIWIRTLTITGSVLKRFVECVDEICLSLTNEIVSCQELFDVVLICRLMFFTDFSSHLNDLNTNLQRSGKTLDVIFDNIKAFEIKLKDFQRDVNNDRVLNISQTLKNT